LAFLFAVVQIIGGSPMAHILLKKLSTAQVSRRMLWLFPPAFYIGFRAQAKFSKGNSLHGFCNGDYGEKSLGWTSVMVTFQQYLKSGLVILI
jgi:hypothetical protein